MSELRALRRAVKIAGGQSVLARKCSEIAGRHCNQRNVWSWLNRSERVADDWAIHVEKAVEGQVTRHELRPDLYPMEEARAA